MPLRKVIFWIHLITGCAVGAVVFLMSVTGVALTYEKQMLAWERLDFYADPPKPASHPIPVEQLIRLLPDQGGEMPSRITIYASARSPVAFDFGREKTVYVNPYTTEVYGEVDPLWPSFFRTMVSWHRWLGAEGEGRDIGRAVTGACNLGFLFLVMSGFYIWWPAQWNWPRFRAILLFRNGLSGKASDFNWHNVIGFWSLVPLFLVVLSGTVISYPWASDAVYLIAGEEPAKRGPRPAGPGASERGREAVDPIPLDGLGLAFHFAQEVVPDWSMMSVGLPLNDPETATFTVDRGAPGQPHLRSMLTLDRRGAIVKHETFAANSPGRKARTLLRFIHSGEAGGMAGQTIAGFASAGAAVLVYTGFALSWRRFWAWRKRKGQAADQIA